MRKKKSTASKGKAQRPRAPRGQVGPQTYEAVKKIAEANGIPLTKAFEEVAQATGRKASTVAVTYYRISRKMGGGRRRGKRSANAKGRGAAQRGQSMMPQVSAALATIERIIREQAAEIERLKGESQLARRIRQVFEA